MDIETARTALLAEQERLERDLAHVRGEAIDPSRVLKRVVYHHPLYTPAAVAAQSRHREIDGARRTYFCGAYWRFGFHEDGVRSGVRVAEHFGVSL